MKKVTAIICAYNEANTIKDVILSISDESKTLNTNSFQNNFNEFIEPLFEAGFGIGHVLIPMKLEFTWRLNYREENGFVIAINSIAL